VAVELDLNRGKGRYEQAIWEA